MSEGGSALAHGAEVDEEALLGERGVLLTQSVAWAKYGDGDGVTEGRYDNADQRMHMDYGNHTWVMPSDDWDRPEAVAAIVFLSDTSATGGGTAVVKREGPEDEAYAYPYTDMPGIGGLPFANDRETAEALLEAEAPAVAERRRGLYAREERVAARPGDVLLYRLDTIHRGTPVARGRVRYAVNLLWRRRESAHIFNWNPAFTSRNYGGAVERFVATLNTRQLVSIGFPPPGSPFWASERRRAAVQARYGFAGFDVAAFLGREI